MGVGVTNGDKTLIGEGLWRTGFWDCVTASEFVETEIEIDGMAVVSVLISVLIYAYAPVDEAGASDELL